MNSHMYAADNHHDVGKKKEGKMVGVENVLKVAIKLLPIRAARYRTVLH